MKHQLTLVRKSDDDAIFRTAAVAAGKVVIDKISWFMPHVLPADAEKFSHLLRCSPSKDHPALALFDNH